MVRRLEAQFGKTCLSVRIWHTKFLEGRTQVENEPHVRHPRASGNKANLATVRCLLEHDGHLTVAEIAAQIGISFGSHYRKRREFPIRNVILHDDNTRPHTANLTCKMLEEVHWTTLEHTPYCRDLSPCDYHMFGPLKGALGGERFVDDAGVEAFVCN
ncbi:hypothetical protein NQ318_006449 [Aromia moschata]|uniref:Transposase n=1 Tax=Aromia moschata TaxID=1265417 RepID=A0AAV8XQC8_9CUCU|nr:hypothetical protein NQ318_006449 [Aromia moschata]